ncbi:signal recognition particle-docking protein FtsY [Thalassotalea ponticola]|uniref:signal recognition particle-docking protein FtsY n=1 Tax=Thalassotalea ponticola TaxID=1523392 RepID=UPI0025B2FC0A|nr:signal recognition particle-docking protein FtsY [Thalassotalea ponticola]MDN3652464.1 signal recognition particle-docking protein FtsY [Thalassotalea ponticola]
MANKKGLFSWFKKDKSADQAKASEQPTSNTDTEQQSNQVSDDANLVTTGSDDSASAPVDTADNDTTEQTESKSEKSPAPELAESDAPEVANDADQDATAIDNAAEAEPIDNALDTAIAASEQSADEATATADAEPVPAKKVGFFSRLKQGLSKTRQNLGGGIFDLFKGKKIDDDLFEELETQLLLADVGVDTTMRIIDSLTDTAKRSQLSDAEALYDLLKQELANILDTVEQPEVNMNQGPHVILMVGVNGVGKTTTIGKLAKQFQAQGKSVMLAAGDTFRAAAVEQLQVWGDRNDIPVIAQHTGADSASVIFDAINSAKSKGVDVLIADTAGRLQNKAHLMEELKKVVRVMKKIDPNAPHQVMLTIDAGTGQNAISQTQLFNEAVGLTAINVTKLDGTAKGGVIFALADKFNLPIRYLGVGEGIDDLRPFNGKEFIDALFAKHGES